LKLKFVFKKIEVVGVFLEGGGGHFGGGGGGVHGAVAQGNRV